MSPGSRKYKRAKPKFLAPEVLEETSRRMIELLRNEGIRAAVAGGFAMQVYGSPRLTGDVDFLAEALPASAEPLTSIRSLVFGGQRYVAPDGVEIDLIVRADHQKALYEAALDLSVVTEDGLPLLAPEYLAVIKFAAGRPKDEDDLLWLLQAEGLVDREKALSIAEEHLGGGFARDSLKSFMDEADWRRERERRGPDAPSSGKTT